AAFWLAYAIGAGAAYRGPHVGWFAKSNSNAYAFDEPSQVIQSARAGFIEAGGASTLIPLSRRNSSPPNHQTVAEALLSGLCAMFVPLSILRAGSIVTIVGGRGLTWLADLDTAFVDVTLIAVALILFLRWRRACVNAQLAVFMLLFGVATTMLMA